LVGALEVVVMGKGRMQQRMGRLQAEYEEAVSREQEHSAECEDGVGGSVDDTTTRQHDQAAFTSPPVNKLNWFLAPVPRNRF
jgi:hypothetical protein